MAFAIAQDGTKLFYETLGTGEPLLLVMGQGSDHHGWDRVREDFAARYQVIVYDHRGTGQSDKPQTAYSTRLFASDAIAILDHLNITQAHVYGISMGGRICQWLAIDYPERVITAVLGCTTPGNKFGVKRPFAVDQLMMSQDSNAIEAEFVSAEWMATQPDYIRWREKAAQNPIPDFARLLHYQASENHDSWADLPNITTPTLIIHGDNDRINMTANAYLLADRIPNAELHIIKGGRHLYYEEFRQESSQIVLDFLAKHRVNAD